MHFLRVFGYYFREIGKRDLIFLVVLDLTCGYHFPKKTYWLLKTELFGHYSPCPHENEDV